MRRALALAFFVSAVLASIAHAGRLSAGLQRQVRGMEGQDDIKVLVVLSEQADIETLDRDLRDTKARMAERHRRVVETLMETAERTQPSLLAQLELERATGVIREVTSYWLINAIGVVTTVDALGDLAARDDVDVIEPHLVVEPIEPIRPEEERAAIPRGGITPGVIAIQADRVWDELGIDGTGALVANLDTGVDGAHPAVSSRWRGNFAPWSECWRDGIEFGDATPVDRHFHGTHVMGTICGTAPGNQIGVAPGALWIADNSINQGAGSELDADVLGSLQWFSDPDGNPFTIGDVPDVVQNSWGVHEGFAGYFDCDSRWWAAIDNCEAAGVVTTWSAGNEGPAPGSVRSPADRADSPFNAFSVGSTIHSPPYTIASSSSRGPSGCGGPHSTKPEVAAPGKDIWSAEPGGGYRFLSGTSMAGPHVAGVVALMRAANPDVDVRTIKQILMDTATDLGPAGEDNTYGHGLINAYAAVSAVLDGYGVIEGDVRDAFAGRSIAGAQIDVMGDPRSATADSVGHYRIPLPVGEWTLEYSAFGYVTELADIVIVADETLNGDRLLSAAPHALVSGVVRDFDGGLVEGATITVLATPLADAISWPNGSYSVSVPDEATYELIARKDGLGADIRTVVVSGSTTQDFLLPELVHEDFESGGFSVWPWVMGGAAPWTLDTSDPYEGAYAAVSGAINHAQVSFMELTLTLADLGDMSFWYRVSSQASFDYLRFYIDDVQQGAWSGIEPWTKATFPVTNGTHTFRWMYSKDGSGDAGSDAAWVDFIEFPEIGPPVFPEIEVAPLSLQPTLPPGGAAQEPLTIVNTGEGSLLYSVAILEGAGPERRLVGATADRVPPADLDLPKGAGDPRRGESPLSGAGGPDGWGYRWIDSDESGGPVYEWAEISVAGTAHSLGDDELTEAIAIGFPFSYYGNSYTTVKACSNGFLTFTDTDDEYLNESIPNSTSPNDILSPYWDDMNPEMGGNVYSHMDVANGRFIVQWDAVPHYFDGDPQTFQVILWPDGTIIYQYQTVSEATDCTVGIENATGTDGLQIVFNGSYLHDGLAVRISDAPPVPWLSVVPLAGVVAPMSEVNLTVSYDAAGLPEGVYGALLELSSNDQAEPTIEVPVTLTVSSDPTGVGGTLVPASFALGRPRPNPFGALTSIDYAVPAGGARVTIDVFDVSGRRVRGLVTGSRPAGRWIVAWDGRDAAGGRAAAGVYFYRMVAGEFSQVRKVTLLK